VIPDNPKEVYFFGGWDSESQYNSMTKYNFITNEMIFLEPEGEAPSCRSCHSATVYGSKIIIFGGSCCKSGEYEFYNDVYIYETQDNSWSVMKCKGDLPQPRSQHSATLIKNNLVIVGGYSKLNNGTALLSDVWSLNLKSKTWKEMKCGGEGPAGFYVLDENYRVFPCSHTTSLVDKKHQILLVYGLCHFYQPEATLYFLDAKNWIWTKIGKNELPGLQCHTSSNLKENEILIFGGLDSEKSSQNNLIRIIY